jgi:thiamine phosphate synthase YjbQ (UPF0047 family)
MASAVSGVSAVCHKEGVDPGECHAVYIVLPHITANVFINDDKRGLHADYEEGLGGARVHSGLGKNRPRA